MYREHGHGSPRRYPGDRPAAAGRARPGASLLGQEAAQIGSARRCRPGHGLSLLPRAWRRLVPRLDPMKLLELFRGVVTAAGTRGSTSSTCTRSSSASRPCTPPATRWAFSVMARTTGRDRLLRRRRPSQGDVNEAFVLASGLQRPGRVLLPEQPVGHLRAAGPAVPRSALPARQRGFGFPGVRVDGNDVWPARGHRRPRSSTPARAGPDADRGVHLPHGRAHHLR